LTKAGGTNRDPLGDQPLLASNGDPLGTPKCIYENALQSVTRSDLGIHLGGSNERLRDGKERGYRDRACSGPTLAIVI
jgi:hypothetical protein